MSTDLSPDVIIVGSGPSGVSAAWPLIEGGLTVLMVDAGKRPNLRMPGGTDLDQIRRNDPNQWRYFLGEDFVGISGDRNETPKFKVPNHQYVYSEFADFYGIEEYGIKATGSLAKGGLSNVWGAGAFAFQPKEIRDWPINPSELSLSTRRVANRIGISGVLNDDLSADLGNYFAVQPPVPLSENTSRVLHRYEKRKKPGSDVKLGRTRNAVLTEAAQNRRACNTCNLCLYGCERGSIYSAADEVPVLNTHPNFTYLDNCLVTGIERIEGKWSLLTANGANGNPKRLSASSIVLAAGTVASSFLIANHLKQHETDIPILCHPAFAMVLLMPERLGTAATTRGFALGQLAYQINGINDSEDSAFGVIFSPEGVMASDIAQYLPMSRVSAVRVIQTLMPALLIANCYLPSRYSQALFRLKKSVVPGMTLEGDYHRNFHTKVNEITAKLRRFFLELGVIMLPGGIRKAHLGSDGHFAGSYPMARDGGRHTTTPDCELPDAPGIYVCDGTPLPSLPAKHPTLTIMANADRVGRKIATKHGRTILGM